MRILYFGVEDKASTTWHRGEALRRLGNEITYVDLGRILAISDWAYWKAKVHCWAGYRLIQRRISNAILQFKDDAFDLVWVNSGEFLGPKPLAVLQAFRSPLILYNNDDVTGSRDGRRFDMTRRAIPHYDLCCVRRDVNVQEYYRAGARKVLRVWMNYDEGAHVPFENRKDIPPRFCSDVAFVGTWMRGERRDEFLLHLVDQGIDLKIWGNRWEKSPYWDRLRIAHQGGALSGRDYVAAMQGAKISIGLLSKGNRDLHTRRSVEIPYVGGLLCAERTSEHLTMYEEGEQAVFWSSPDECAHVCKELLSDVAKRERIRLAGMQRVRELKVGNEDVCQQILNEVAKL